MGNGELKQRKNKKSPKNKRHHFHSKAFKKEKGIDIPVGNKVK